MALIVIFLTLLSTVGVFSTGGEQMSPVEIEYCCNLVSEMDNCHSACMKFASKCPPAVTNKTEYLKDFCSEVPAELDACLSNTNLSNSQPKPTPSQELISCCGSSENQACEDVCIEQLYIGKLDEEAIEKVIVECGYPIMVDSDPIWTCFFDFADDDNDATPQPTESSASANCSSETTPEVETTEPSLTITYADWPRLECCSRSNTTECKEACEREYSGNRNDGSWEKINLDCIYQPNEDDLAICLADVTSRCTPGCSGLDFCQNFNNRPLQLFRNCDNTADNIAEDNYEEWRRGEVTLPLVTFKTKDVSTCLPDLWKAAACAIYTRPCDNDTHSSILCKDECLLLMEECSIDKLKSAEEICEILSPAHLQERCVPISQFTEPSPQSLSEANVITTPCHPDPCSKGRHCIVNHDCSGNRDKACTPYTCAEESQLGKNPKLSLVKTDSVHVTTLPHNGKQCYGFVDRGNGEEEFSQQLSDVSLEYCRPDLQQCVLEGRHYDHGDMFKLSDGCNFCSCFHGELLCSHHACLEATENLGPTPLLSCDCPTFYLPICTATGRTLPNSCIAGCLGYSSGQYQLGSCSDKHPCDHSLCPESTKCVPRKHTCLSNTTSCPQYSCETYFSCNQFTSPVCDRSNNQHGSLCDIFLTEEKIDYFGYCQLECSSGRSQFVCGVNGETFQSKCHALQAGIAVDYIGECREIPSGSQGCDTVKCPGEHYFSTNETCSGPVPPGACCQQCGGMLKAIVDQDGLRYSTVNMNSTSINSTDVIERMRSHLNVLECRLNGYIALDGTFVFLLMPTNYTTFLNVEVCNMEAIRLSTLINNRSPVLVSDPFLHFLVAATPSLATTKLVTNEFAPNSVTDEHSGCGQTTPLLYMLALMVLIFSYVH